MGYLAVDPIKALGWSAVVSGVIPVPITRRHLFFGWAATVAMAVAVLVMLKTNF